MCFSYLHRRRRRGHTESEKGQSALKRLVATSMLISPTNRRVNSNLIDGTDNEKAEFFVFLSDVVQRHLRRVYDEQRRPRSFLTRDEFATFLKETQKNSAELSARPLELETYDFSQFLWTWYRNYGWRAMRRAAVKDLSKPISHYFISSSHNTFLEGNQWSSPSTANAYRHVLEQDCRCIEIDVWNGEAAVRTPSRSRSPHPGAHGRHLSAVSLPSAAATALGVVGDTYESVKDVLSGKHRANHGHDRKSSANLPRAPNTSSPAKESAVSLEPESANELRGRARASSQSSRQSAHSKEEPIVMHGYTLTRPVGFREVCKAIRETAFATNGLPIIVSLQVGATTEQQEVMVEIMKEEWAGLLLEQPHESCNPCTSQPRLEELLNKILVKVKRAPETEKPSMPTGESTRESTLSRSTLSPHSTVEANGPGAPDERLAAAQRKKGKNEPICHSLGALAVYTHSEHFDSLTSPAARLPGHIFSLSESQIDKLHTTRRQELLAHNTAFFMRAYPSPGRVFSSNPNPDVFWRKGVQMVAMNWQSLDEGMMLNWGMFAGEKGWVLKPEAYRRAGPASGGVPGPPGASARRTLDLRITLFAGQHIPLPEARERTHQGQGGVGGARDRSFRPYVKCELHVEKDEGDAMASPTARKAEGGREGEYKRRTTARETDSPDFGKLGETIEFENVGGVIEELSFVRFKVQDECLHYRETLAAWACIRLDRLRQGYRFIELLDPNGNPTDGKLFVRIEKVVR